MRILSANNENNEGGFEEELRLAQVPVLGFLVRLTGNVDDAHDLLQQTNLTAWEKRDAYEPESNLIAWMCSIAKNHYRNQIQKSDFGKTVPLLDDDVAVMVEARHEERELEEARKRRLLRHCIEQLPERHRAFVESFYIEGNSLQEVADANDIKVNAVAQLLFRARQNLIKCVRRKSHLNLDKEI